MADLTDHGMKLLKKAICNIRELGVKRIDLGHDTIVYKIPSNKGYTIRIDMKFEEREDK